MKIAFLVPGVSISGGVNVVFEHAVRINRRGFMQVYIITKEVILLDDLFWHPDAKELQWLTYEEAKHIEFDAAIATFWETCYEAYKLNSKYYIYFNQSVESKFYNSTEIANKKSAEATYLLGYYIITEATWIKNYLFESYGLEAELVLNGIRKDFYSTNIPALLPRVKGKLRILVEGPLKVPFKNVEKTIELCLKSNADEVWLLTSSKVSDYPGVARTFSQVPMSKTAEIYRSCDVLVKLSYVEGMFGPPLEMFHCGGTAIVYDVTGHDEYISNNQNAIVVETDNENAVINAINYLKEYPAECNRLQNGALITASFWSDWDEASLNFENALMRIMKYSPTKKNNLKERAHFFYDWYQYTENFKVKNDFVAHLKINAQENNTNTHSIEIDSKDLSAFKVISINLESYKKIDSIEFAPIKGCCNIFFKEMTVTSASKKIKINKKISSNAIISEHPFYFFNTNSPIILFDLSDVESAESFMVEFKFLNIGKYEVSEAIIKWQKNKLDIFEKYKLFNILNFMKSLKKAPKFILFYLRYYVKKLFANFFLLFDYGKPYNDNFFHNQAIHEKSNNRLVVFSHYDRHNIIHDYILYYLSEIKKLGADIVFVSTAERLNDHELQKISHLCKRVVVKQNIGYDFGSWRAGIGLESEALNQYEQLVLCNDSVYAPLCDLNNMFDTMQKKYDFWGLTDNYQHCHHIQSYFMVFSKKVFLQAYFLEFWRSIRVFKYKESIIRHYEIGLTKLLRNHNINYGVYCPSEYQSKMNATHYEWKKLIIDQKCPIMKIELLRDNPTKTDISDWESVVSTFTSYDPSLIISHLKKNKL